MFSQQIGFTFLAWMSVGFVILLTSNGNQLLGIEATSITQYLEVWPIIKRGQQSKVKTTFSISPHTEYLRLSTLSILALCLARGKDILLSLMLL